MALILGLAIGAASFYVLKVRKQPAISTSTKASTAAAVMAPVAVTVSPFISAAPPVSQAAASNAASPTSDECLDLSKQEPHSLEGRLVSAIFANLPNNNHVRKGGDPVGGYVLELKSSICIRAGGQDDGPADPGVKISEVQLFPKDRDLRIEATMRSLLGFDVRTGFSAVQAESTGHEHRPIIAWVSSMIPIDEVTARTIIPRIISPHIYPIYPPKRTEDPGLAATVVQAFYIALSLGAGEAASSFVVPEKRSAGAYAPESLTNFYGPLPEPLSVVEFKTEGPNEYLVKYTYGTSTRRCQGRAIVTTTQRDDVSLIEKIHSLDRC